MHYDIYESPKGEHRRSGRIAADDTRSRAVLEERGWRIVETIDAEAPDVGASVAPAEAGDVYERATADLTDAQRTTLAAAGLADVQALRDASDDDLRALDGFGPAAVRDLRKALAGPQV